MTKGNFWAQTAPIWSLHRSHATEDFGVNIASLPMVRFGCLGPGRIVEANDITETFAGAHHWEGCSHNQLQASPLCVIPPLQ